jgi:transposase
VLVTVHMLVATLSYSRHMFVKVFLGERTAEWLDDIFAAFRHFGGATQKLLCARARGLVASTRAATGADTFTPALLQFCRDWSLTPRVRRDEIDSLAHREAPIAHRAWPVPA